MSNGSPPKLGRAGVWSARAGDHAVVRSRWNILGTHPNLIKAVKTLSFAGMLGGALWLFSQFLQVRGVVDLQISRVFLGVLGIFVFLMTWFALSQLFSGKWRAISAIIALVAVILLDVFVPKPKPTPVPLTVSDMQRELSHLLTTDRLTRISPNASPPIENHLPPPVPNGPTRNESPSKHTVDNPAERQRFAPGVPPVRVDLSSLEPYANISDDRFLGFAKDELNRTSTMTNKYFQDLKGTNDLAESMRRPTAVHVRYEFYWLFKDCCLESVSKIRAGAIKRVGPLAVKGDERTSFEDLVVSCQRYQDHVLAAALTYVPLFRELIAKLEKRT